MKLSRRKLLAGVLLIVLASGSADLLGRRSPRAADATTRTQPRQPGEADLNAGQLVERLLERPARSVAALQRDPFTPSPPFVAITSPPPPPPPQAAASLNEPDARATFASRHKLSATLTGAKPLAVIDGKVFTLGGLVDGLRITRIESHRVFLADGREQVELVIPPPLVQSRNQPTRD